MLPKWEKGKRTSSAWPRTYSFSTGPRLSSRLSEEWLRLSPMTKTEPSGISQSVPCMVLLPGWTVILAAMAVAVYCIFGMEKDWVSRGLAYALIAAAMAAVGAASILIFRFAAGEGQKEHGTRQD